MKNRYVIALDGLDFSWDPKAVEKVKKLWSDGRHISDIAKTVRRDIDEVALLVMHLARKKQIKPRNGGCFGVAQGDKTAKIVIPGTLPGMNEIIAAAKKHPMSYAGMKEENTDAVTWIAKRVAKFNKVDVSIHWICRDRRKDKDNIMAGTKFVLDGLVAAGVIPNDSWKYVGNIRHSFDVDKHDPRIEVTLGECG